jgi:phytoene dehydrogenase-like protein
VELANGVALKARQVLSGTDPFTLRELTGAEHFGRALNTRLDAMKRPGSTLKLNLALDRLPTFTCLPEDRGQFCATMHLLPDEDEVLTVLGRAFAASERGALPAFPAIEWYVHSTVDPSLRDPAGRLSSALFVQWVPYEIAGSSWDKEAERYADHLLSICDRFAPGTSSLVADRMVLHPQAIEERFGMRYGHIHHIDNGFGFADRFPHHTPVPGLYSCSAGTHPAGSVIGCAGFIAAKLALADG